MLLRRIGVLAAAALMAVGLGVAAAPQAPAATSYTWVHQWDKTGSGVTTQYSTSGFNRLSYVHGSTCTEEWQIFWSSGNLADYYRHSGTSSCSGVHWTLKWTTPSAGANSSLNWQVDLNVVLRNSGGAAVWASGTNHSSTYITGERWKLGNNANGYLYVDYFTFCCYWTADKRFP